MSATTTLPRPHRALRVDHAIMRWRARRAREGGFHPAVIPYTGYGSTDWVRVLCRVLLTREAVGGHQPAVPTGARGWRSFTSIPVEAAEVKVRINDTEHIVRADSSGIVDARVEASLPPGWHHIELSSEGSTPVKAHVQIVDPAARIGLVSDIDDTVMVTALPRPLLAAWHTFVVNEHARATTPGMPVLYERFKARYPDAPVVYLSTGAWNVAPTLTRFLSRNLYPAGALLLTDWGPTADRWFRSGVQHKRASLEQLVTEFPQIRWVLIGDDGQHDESIYADFAEKHASHVLAVCIRQLSSGEAVLAGSSGRREHRDTSPSPVPWAYAPDGAGFAQELDRLGILRDTEHQPEAEA